MVQPGYLLVAFELGALFQVKEGVVDSTQGGLIFLKREEMEAENMLVKMDLGLQVGDFEGYGVDLGSRVDGEFCLILFHGCSLESSHVLFGLLYSGFPFLLLHTLPYQFLRIVWYKEFYYGE